MALQTWLRRALTGIIVLIFTIFVIIGLLALTKDDNKKAGILTLHFNVTSLSTALQGRNSDNRGLIESIESHATSIVDGIETVLPSAESQLRGAASSAIGGLGTAVPKVASQIWSAADTFVTELPADLEAILPRNYSIGTDRFCIGLANNISCHKLPPNVSNIIPSDIRGRIVNDFSGIRDLDSTLKNITTRAIRDLWIVGLVLMSLILLSSIVSIFGFVLFKLKAWMIMFHLVTGLLFCIPFFVPVAILHTLHSKFGDLPGWVQVVQGDLNGLFIGGLCCAVTMVVLCSALAGL